VSLCTVVLVFIGETVGATVISTVAVIVTKQQCTSRIVLRSCNSDSGSVTVTRNGATKDSGSSIRVHVVMWGMRWQFSYTVRRQRSQMSQHVDELVRQRMAVL
jgi:hypothetical protein